jgi:hypothetical protein
MLCVVHLREIAPCDQRDAQGLELTGQDVVVAHELACHSEPVVVALRADRAQWTAAVEEAVGRDRRIGDPGRRASDLQPK